MAHITSRVEYALHCLLWMVDVRGTPLSSRELAELQGVSASFLAKIFPQLEKAGLVVGTEGVQGGYRLARDASTISVLEIVDAVEGAKPLFDCQEIRRNCVLFGGRPPAWATRGPCAIHAVMISAERAMRDRLAEHTLASLSASLKRKAPSELHAELGAWVEARARIGRASRGSGAAATKATKPAKSARAAKSR